MHACARASSSFRRGSAAINCFAFRLIFREHCFSTSRKASRSDSIARYYPGGVAAVWKLNGGASIRLGKFSAQGGHLPRDGGADRHICIRIMFDFPLTQSLGRRQPPGYLANGETLPCGETRLCILNDCMSCL